MLNQDGGWVGSAHPVALEENWSDARLLASGGVPCLEMCHSKLCFSLHWPYPHVSRLPVLSLTGQRLSLIGGPEIQEDLIW